MVALMTEQRNESGDELPEDAGDGTQDPQVAAKKKKRRPKKKGVTAAATEINAQAAEEDQAEIHTADARVECAGEPQPADGSVEKVPEEGQAGGESQEDSAGEAGPVAVGALCEKKKQRPKKKPAEAENEAEAEAGAEEGRGESGAALGEEASKPETPAATKKRKSKKKVQSPEALTVTEGAAAEESDEAPAKEESEHESEEDAAPTKKKKRRPKKKGGASNTPGQSGNKPVMPDEEFAEWAARTLVSTANGTEKMRPEELLRPPQVFWGYKYTGALRPAYVSPQMKMPEGWCLPDYALDPEGVSYSERRGPKEVPILEGVELETMREACRLGREVLDIAARFMRPGVTGDQIDRVVFQACVDRKIYPSPLNYFRFPKSVCVSPNEVICHGIPDSRPIEDGDIVNLDVSVYFQGFHSDLNETFFVGQCDEDSHRLVRTAYCALHAAAQQIRPGTFYRDLGSFIHAEAAKSNCAVVTTYCGHGVGALFHGPPKVPHYRKNKAVGIMKPGHVFTVEPMINLGSNGGDRTWPDNWTAVTRDGKRSAQFEHTFLVTEAGLEVLTSRTNVSRTAMPLYDPAMFQV